MSWMSQGPRIFRLAGGLAIGVSAVAIGVKKANLLDSQEAGENPKALPTPLNKVLASWTTNFNPSQEWDYNWDRREPKTLVKPAKEKEDENKDEYNEKLKKVTPTATRHLILIRHGQYEMGPKDDKNRVLTALGREQADFTGKRLKEMPFNYDKLIHSTMTRARETASIILKHLPNDLPVDVTDSLVEGAPYPPEPKVGHWKPEHYFYQDGARIESAFRRYFHRASADQEKDTYEVVVCHANVIRYFACRALQIPPEAWLRMSLHHGSITWVAIRPSGRVALKCLGDAGFMPAEKLTTS